MVRQIEWSRYPKTNNSTRVLHPLFYSQIKLKASQINKKFLNCYVGQSFDSLFLSLDTLFPLVLNTALFCNLECPAHFFTSIHLMLPSIQDFYSSAANNSKKFTTATPQQFRHVVRTKIQDSSCSDT